MSRIRVLSINLWNVNPPLELRMRRLAAHLRAQRYDLVALQEVSDYGAGSQADFLAAEAGFAQTVSDWASRGDERGEGLAVLSQRPVASSQGLDLPAVARDGPRIAQRLTIDVDGTEVDVVNTHLTHLLDAATGRTEQARHIAARLRADDVATLLFGDLNDSPASAPLRVLTGPPVGLVDALAVAGNGDKLTWSSANPWLDQSFAPDRRLDYVLHSADVHPVACDVVLDAPGEEVSDHYGVAATVDLPG